MPTASEKRAFWGILLFGCIIGLIISDVISTRPTETAEYRNLASELAALQDQQRNSSDSDSRLVNCTESFETHIGSLEAEVGRISDELESFEDSDYQDMNDALYRGVSDLNDLDFTIPYCN